MFNVILEFKALIARSTIAFRAYGNTGIRVRQWVDDLPAAFAVQQQSSSSASQRSDAAADGGAAQRTVKLTGFGYMSVGEIDENKDILSARLESTSRRGGPVERLQVKQSRLGSRKPFVLATFRSSQCTRVRENYCTVTTVLWIQYSTQAINQSKYSARVHSN